MSAAKTRKCAQCGASMKGRGDNAAFPFCSPRCKQIDLGRWLGGDYVISRSLIPESVRTGRPWGAGGGGSEPVC